MSSGSSADAGAGTATVARWSRALVATGVAFFVAWQVAALAGSPRPATVVLGLQGFVLHVVFGKAYELVPSYFARDLAVPRAPAVHLPLASLGMLGLFAAAADFGMGPSSLERGLGPFGAGLRLCGCLVFVGSLGRTLGGNLAGTETGTGDVDRHRERVDWAANAAMPIVLAYLLVVSPRPALVALVLPAGAVGPALIALDLHGGRPFRIGAALEALALVGFAVAYADMFRRSERRRAGGWTILAAVGFGVAAALLGVAFATESGATATAHEIHYRLALGGFLGLTIVGVSLHLYPPGVASSRFVDDRTAALAVAALVAGLALEATGALAAGSVVATGGRALAALGAIGYAVALGAVVLERPV